MPARACAISRTIYRHQHRSGSKPGFPWARIFIFSLRICTGTICRPAVFYPFTPAPALTVYGGHDKSRRPCARNLPRRIFPSRRIPEGENCYQRLVPGQAYHIAGGGCACANRTPRRSYGYRFEPGRPGFVYSPTASQAAEISAPNYPLAPFYADADLLVFDAMYSLEEPSTARPTGDIRATSSALNWPHARACADSRCSTTTRTTPTPSCRTRSTRACSRAVSPGNGPPIKWAENIPRKSWRPTMASKWNVGIECTGLTAGWWPGVAALRSGWQPQPGGSRGRRQESRR